MLCDIVGKKSLFIGIGGGGDVATAAILAKALERSGGKAFIGSIVWERYVVDPIPGPIAIDELRNVRLIKKCIAIVTPDSYAIRGGRKIIPQPANVAKALNTEVIVLDLRCGARKLAEELESVCAELGVESVVGVDVGGDVLARGDEDNLWSPLADSIGLAMLALMRNVKPILAVASPGADGELDQLYVLKRVCEIASRGGLLGAYGYSLKDIETLRKVLQYAITEASQIPIKVFMGECCFETIRSGVRMVRITPVNIVVYFLDPRITIVDTLAQHVVEAESLDEANSILNSRCIYTELDLERDLYDALLKGLNITTDEVLEIRRRGVERIKSVCRK